MLDRLAKAVSAGEEERKDEADVPTQARRSAQHPQRLRGQGGRRRSRKLLVFWKLGEKAFKGKEDPAVQGYVYPADG